jgi:FkbM family methyltransferase
MISLHRGPRQLRSAVRSRAFEAQWRRRHGKDSIHLGSEYGGWAVPRNVVTSDWTCYTAGVGEDASFDLALAELGCDVVAIDPTPRAIAYMQSLLAAHPNLRLAPYAVWDADTEIEFFPPANIEHVSYSATNRQRTADPIRVPARTISSIALEFRHQRIDLLKLDVEGAEYPVLESLDLESLQVQVLCVEFHDDHGFRRMGAAVRSVLQRGFDIAAVRRTDITFIRTDLGQMASPREPPR